MRFLFTSLLVLTFFIAKSQSGLYSDLFSFISSETKESTVERLISLNVWSVEDRSSRNLNQEFDKAFFAYSGAKLKGGSKGIIVVVYCIDKDEVQINIALKKDGLTKVISTNSTNKTLFSELKNKMVGYNIVFDKDGKVIYENLKAGTVFDSIHSLITR